MSRRLAALTWAWAVFALVHVGPAQTVAPGAGALETARARLAQGQARAAVDGLEMAVPRLGVAERGAALALLREAYPAAIREAEAAGLKRAAANLRENAAILERAARQAGAEPLPAPTTTPAAGTARSQDAPAPPAALGATTPTPAPAASGPARGLAALSDRTAPESAATPAPSPEAAPPAAEPEPEPEASPAPAEDANRSILEGADAAFRAKDYAKAGGLYATLNAAGALPEVRLDPWAYCRMVAVVNRINAGPKAAADWSQIRAETEQIRQLSPKNWYAEYLRNLTTELAAAPRRGDGPAVLRGASPEERPAPAPGRPAATRVARRAPPEARAAAPASIPPADEPVVGGVGAAVGTWQVWETTNFRILHGGDVALAQRAARVAEATRADQMRRWAAADGPAPWAPRCDVYLYPTAALFAQMTGQPADSPGFSTMGLNAGRVVARRVNLRADHANLLAAVLPHEVTHVVLADLFPDLQIPRWADEGIAVLAEPDSEQSLRAADLSRPLEAGQLFALGDLMRMDYPDGKYWSLYYAQSVSLTRFLVAQGTPSQFVQFVRGSQRNGVEAELKRVYGIDSLDALQARWLAFARGGATAVAVADPAPEPAGASVAR